MRFSGNRDKSTETFLDKKNLGFLFEVTNLAQWGGGGAFSSFFTKLILDVSFLKKELIYTSRLGPVPCKLEIQVCIETL